MESDANNTSTSNNAKVRFSPLVLQKSNTFYEGSNLCRVLQSVCKLKRLKPRSHSMGYL